MELTKLDNYDYSILPGVITIQLCGTNDPDLVDIMSEINRSNGRIYLDGKHYKYANKYQILGSGENTFIDIYVTQM